jgi:hypothetical protein
MTREDFVKAIKTEALDLAVRDTILDLQDPPGRKPEIALMSVHRWYEKLDPKSQEFVQQVARMAAESATFGVLAILDGVRAIEAGEKGDLILEYRKGEERLILNNFRDKLLHEILVNWFDVVSNPQNLPVDLQHVPHSELGAKLIPDYDPETGPCVALPTREHKNLPSDGSNNSAQEEFAKQLQNLRDHTNIPEPVIQKLALDVLQLIDAETTKTIPKANGEHLDRRD